MTKSLRCLSPSLEAGSVTETPAPRPSLFDTKDAFIARIAPFSVAAFYFGSFTLSPKDAPLSRQALFKISFLNRQFLQAGGLKITVNQHTAVLSGQVTSAAIVTLGEILAQQIEGIDQVVNETTLPEESTLATTPHHAAREAVQYLFATDQTLRSGVQVGQVNGHLTLDGEVSSVAQKNWAEQLGQAVSADIQSRLQITSATTFASVAMIEPPSVDDESLQALILFRLRLIRETEHVPVRVKAVRGVVTLQGKVRTEAMRQRVENIARSTLGLRELRSSVAIAA
jgi:osmotically-inducible protein OsmY